MVKACCAYGGKDKNMNRYDYYTRCANFDEQEWLTEELYYPDRDDYRCGSESDYEDDHRDYEWEDNKLWDDEDSSSEVAEPFKRPSKEG